MPNFTTILRIFFPNEICLCPNSQIHHHDRFWSKHIKLIGVRFDYGVWEMISERFRLAKFPRKWKYSIGFDDGKLPNEPGEVVDQLIDNDNGKGTFNPLLLQRKIFG
jgi:hypothetical protein